MPHRFHHPQHISSSSSALVSRSASLALSDLSIPLIEGPKTTMNEEIMTAIMPIAIATSTRVKPGFLLKDFF